MRPPLLHADPFGGMAADILWVPLEMRCDGLLSATLERGLHEGRLRGDDL